MFKFIKRMMCEHGYTELYKAYNKMADINHNDIRHTRWGMPYERVYVYTYMCNKCGDRFKIVKN